MRDIPLQIVIEDDLSLEVVRKIVFNTRNNFFIDRSWPDLNRNRASRGSGYIKTKINAFNNAAKHGYFIILTDLDTKECAPEYIRDLLQVQKSEKLFLRIAVREVESWLIADRGNFARYLSVSKDIVSPDPESLPDPKEHIFQISKRSRKRTISRGIPPVNKTARTGIEYNSLLITFVREYWDFRAAMKRSDSLRRFVREFDGV